MKEQNYEIINIKRNDKIVYLRVDDLSKLLEKYSEYDMIHYQVIIDDLSNLLEIKS